jgi:transcriptional regulator GlxA family with amidase domain
VATDGEGPCLKRSKSPVAPADVWTPAEASRILLRMKGERYASKQNQVLDLRVARALGALESELARRWNVRSLAKLAGASRATFGRLFRAATGTSPKRWLTARRLERAAVLLVTTDATLAEIALQVGYASEFALSRAFKRHHGVAPARHRQSSPTLRCAA